MTPALFALCLFGCSAFAGGVGAVLGLGGGMLLVPIMTLGFGIDIRYAVGASIVSVIATSSGAAAAYLRERLANVRVAVFLEIATTSGAILGGLCAGILPTKLLFSLFGAALAVSALLMWRPPQRAGGATPPSALAAKLRLGGSYYDQQLLQEVPYQVTRPGLGMALMFVAGTMSGVLGIGSGALKVPAMDLGMRLPLKVSTATSNFMIGVTAAASAGVYFARGEIDPFLTTPVCAGVLLGAFAGARYLPKAKSSHLRFVLVVAIILTSAAMLRRGLS